MKRWCTMWLVLVLLGSLSTVVPAEAAEFSPELEYELSQVGAKDLVSAIVILESPIDIRALDQQLHERRATKAERHREVLSALHYNADQTQPGFRVELDNARANNDVVGYTPYWIENLFVIRATKEYIEALRPRGDIKYVTENFQAVPIAPIRAPGKGDGSPPPISSLTMPPGIQAVGAYRVNTELGITGAGVLVSELDTGVDGTHPALASKWRGYNGANPWWQCWRDPVSHLQFPHDTGQHGTHTMGTICGRGISGSDTVWVGCAPDAQWIEDDVIGTPGPYPSQTFNNGVIDAFQWLTDPDTVNHDPAAVPDVCQNSWGVYTGLGYAQCFDLWNSVILNCEAGGTVITWSAGNEGSNGLRSPAIYSINDWQIYSVGAVDASNYPNEPYPIAGFSSRGPTPCTPAIPDNIKPEVVAPGVNVYSSVPGGGYQGGWDGTSMAGPHVAGVAALMRQACPNCDPQTIKEALMSTAHDYGSPGDDNTYGHGFIDGYAAVMAVSNLGHLVGYVRDGSNNPLVGATVRNPNGLQITQTDATGHYDLPLQEGTYSIAYSKFGYVTQQINGIAIIQGENTVQDANLATAPQGTVSGTVTNCGGGPAVGATVTILDTPIAPATTNGSGFYQINNVPQGMYDMMAEGAGCGPQTVNGVVIGDNTTQNFTLNTDPQFLCSDPDASGYSQCENGDLGGPTYNWFEISPNAGGPGTLTGITGDDQAISIALPFTFRHYGTNYTSVFVSSNGLMTFNSGNSAFTESPLTSLGQPGIAPFWDDLYPPGGGDISKYRYQQGGDDAYIIEWRAIPHYGSGGPYTFQIWLYNVATNPQPNGNSQIRIQYSNMNGTNSCTIGTTGGSAANTSQYVYDNTYDPNAQGLANGRVITYGLPTAPPAPNALTVVYIPGSDQLRFDWEASPGATSYSLYSAASEAGPFTTLVGTSGTNSLTVPLPGTNRLFYVVTAQN